MKAVNTLMKTVKGKIILVGATLLTFSAMSFGEANCRGTISAVYKWHNTEKMSVKVLLSDASETNWIRLPTKSDEGMALFAFAAQKPVHIYWNSADVTSCTSGWSHNRELTGYFLITK